MSSRSRTVIATIAGPWLLLLAACSQPAGLVHATKAGQLISADERVQAGSVVAQSLRGQQLVVSSLRGVPVVLNFFASWCGPCRVEEPGMQAVADHFGGRVAVVGVDTDDRAEAARSFAQGLGLTFPILVDENQEIPLRIGHLAAGPGLPFTVVLDGRGRIAAYYLGPVLPADIRPPLESLLAEDTGPR